MVAYIGVSAVRVHVHCQRVSWRKYMKLHTLCQSADVRFCSSQEPHCFKSVHQVGLAGWGGKGQKRPWVDSPDDKGTNFLSNRFMHNIFLWARGCLVSRLPLSV